MDYLTVGEGEARRQIAYQQHIVDNSGDKTVQSLENKPVDNLGNNVEQSSKSDPKKRGIMWLNGYRSVMAGNKATALHRWAVKQSLNFVRFDYSGLGESGGDFSEGTLSRWLEEACAIYDAMDWDEVIVVGSSMGGWLALRLAQLIEAREAKRVAESSNRDASLKRISAMLLIAPAADYTKNIVPERLGADDWQSLDLEGVAWLDSRYEEKTPLYQSYLDDANQHHLLLENPFSLNLPITIIHGRQDEDIPYVWGLKLAEMCQSVEALYLVPDGDHRLSRPQDLQQLTEIIKGML